MRMSHVVYNSVHTTCLWRYLSQGWDLPSIPRSKKPPEPSLERRPYADGSEHRPVTAL